MTKEQKNLKMAGNFDEAVAKLAKDVWQDPYPFEVIPLLITFLWEQFVGQHLALLSIVVFVSVGLIRERVGFRKVGTSFLGLLRELGSDAVSAFLTVWLGILLWFLYSYSYDKNDDGFSDFIKKRFYAYIVLILLLFDLLSRRTPRSV